MAIEHPMTRDNTWLEDELICMDGYINAYVVAAFDVDKRFGTSTYDTDDYLNVYANYYPDSKEVELLCVIHYADGSNSDEIAVTDITTGEKELLIGLMDEKSLLENDIGIDEFLKSVMDELDMEI